MILASVRGTEGPFVGGTDEDAPVVVSPERVVGGLVLVADEDEDGRPIWLVSPLWYGGCCGYPFVASCLLRSRCSRAFSRSRSRSLSRSLSRSRSRSEG